MEKSLAQFYLDQMDAAYRGYKQQASKIKQDFFKQAVAWFLAYIVSPVVLLLAYILYKGIIQNIRTAPDYLSMINAISLPLLAFALLTPLVIFVHIFLNRQEISDRSQQKINKVD